MRLEKVGRTGLILLWSRRIRWVLTLALLAYLGMCIYMWATQRQHIFEPTRELQTNPERLGLKFEEVHIPSGKGTDAGNLFAWWIPAANVEAPAVLYLHGNDKNIGAARDLDNAARFHDMGYNLLIFDYRGYGMSTGGEPDEAKMYEDAEAAWNYLVKQRSRNPGSSFIYGHSLGGAVAIELAMRHQKAGGVIVESSFTSLSDMAELEYPYLPADLILNQRFDSLSKVRRLKIPLLLIHGTWDRLVPYHMSQRLFESAHEPKYLKLIDGGEHSNIELVAPLDYRKTVSEFIEHCIDEQKHS